MVVENGKVTGLKTWRVKAIFDEQGRFAPSYDESDEQFHAGSLVVEAIGQMTDASLLGDALTEKLSWNRGRLQVDAGGRSSESWLSLGLSTTVATLSPPFVRRVLTFIKNSTDINNSQSS